jgi:hypothetical protein
MPHSQNLTDERRDCLGTEWLLDEVRNRGSERHPREVVTHDIGQLMADRHCNTIGDSYRYQWANKAPLRNFDARTMFFYPRLEHAADGLAIA